MHTLSLPSLSKRGWSFVFFILSVLSFCLIATRPASAASCTFATTGTNWNSAGSWFCGAIPGAADDAIIPTGANAYLTANSLVNTVSSTGGVNLGAFTLNTNAATTTAGGFISSTSTGGLNATTTLESYGTVSSTSGGIAITGSTSIFSGGTVTSTSGLMTLTGAVSSTGSLGNNSGNMFFGATMQNNGTVNIGSGTATSTGTLTNAAGATFRNQSGILSLLADFVNAGTFTPNSGTVRVAGTAAQALTGTIFNNFASTKTALAASLNASSTVLGTLDVAASGGAISSVTNTLTIVGASSMTGGTVTSTSGTLNFGGAVTSTGTIGSGTGNMTFGSTLQNNGTFAIGSGTATSTGTLTNAAGATLNGSTGVLSLLADFVNAGTFTPSSGTVRVAGTAAQALTGTIFGTLASIKTAQTATLNSSSTMAFLTVTASGGTISSATNTLTVIGASTMTGGTVTSTSGTLNFGGVVTSTGAIGSSTGNQLFSSIFQNNGTFNTGSGNATATGALTNALGATINGGTGLLTLVDVWTNSGTFNPQSGTIRFAGTTAQAIPVLSFNNLSIRGTTLTATLAGSTNVSGTTEIISGETLAVGNNVLTAVGLITNTGTITVGATGSIVHTLESVALTDTSGTPVASYTQGNGIFITVQDSNRNLLGGSVETMIVTLNGNSGSGGDVEYVTLTETSANSGIFRNTSGVGLAATVPSGNNGTFEATQSGTISGSYVDIQNLADTGSNSKSFTVTTVEGTNTGGGGGGGGSSTPITPPITNPTPAATLVYPAGTLFKLPDDGNPNTQQDSAVYYYGKDGKRHAFPNSQVYFTWYSSFSQVQVISLTAMAQVPLGINVTYQPGEKLVKFQTLAKVYAVSLGGELRWIKTEGVARDLYGSNWNTKVDDINDAFFVNYRFGTEINSAADYSPSAQMTAGANIDKNMGL